MRMIASLLLAICSTATCTVAQSSGDPTTMVLALEHAWNQAEERKDTKALDAIFDNALVYVDDDGSIRTKADFLAHVKSSSQPQQEITESMTARMFGSTVIASGIYIIKAVRNGKPSLRRGRFVDTWVFEDGRWLCVASQATPILQ